MAHSLGIEEEYLLVDRDSGALVPRAPDVLAAGAESGDDISAELNYCQIEIATGVHEHLADAARELESRRAALDRLTGPLGTRAAALASHPFSSWYDQEVNTDKERYAQLEETYQRIAWQQAICGCHVHVGIDDPNLRVGVMDRIRPWLPVVLALSANSPYWESTDTGYASYRTIVWKAWPTATMPPRLGTFAAYEALIGELEQVEAIETPKSLYWYVRPSAQFDTLEFRVCDVCLRARDAVTIAGLLRALVATYVEEVSSGKAHNSPSQPVLESAIWRAARYGLDNTLVDPTRSALGPAAAVVDHLVTFVRPALEEAGDLERVTSGIEEILTTGNGAEAQRSAVAAGGEESEIVARILAG